MTVEHVVPRCLFKPPYEGKLIEVFACRDCNNNAKSRDDSFLRDIVACDPAVEAGIDIDYLRAKFYRSAKKGHSELFKTKDAGDAGVELLLPLMSPQSLIPRLRQALKWIVRGLYYHNHNSVLPDKYRYRFRRVSEAEAKKRRDFIASLGIKSIWSVGNRDQFQYVHLWYDDPHTTFWQMVMHKQIFYEGASIPRPSMTKIAADPR